MNNIFRFLESFYFPKITFLDIIEIAIIIILVYQIQKSLKNTRAWMIFKGIIILVIVYLCSSILNLSVIQYIFQSAISLSLIAVIILFEPEIKKFLEELGTHKIKDILKIIKNKEPIVNKRYSDKTIKEILDACNIMSEAKTGALIIIEQDSILNEYINTGIQLNADVTSQLLVNIFEHNTPLHDGAIIIRKDKIISATCYLPLSDNKKINKNLGTRHRAGIGLSEVTDAIVIIVSEETGKISFVKDGKLKHGINIDTLHNLLNEYQTKKETSLKNNIMKQKKEKLKHNFVSKLLSFIFGIFLWTAIINSQDPLVTKTFEIPVEITNENALTETGKTYDIIDGENVNIEVKAARSIINNLTSDDIKAIANFKKLSYTYSVPIEVNIPSLNKNEYSINTNNATMLLKLDELTDLNLNVQIEKNGSCMDGYYLTNLDSNIKSITISGGESIIKTIDKAIVKVNLNNRNEDFTDACSIEIYDKNGNLVNNEDITLSTNEIIVNGTILPTKKIHININLKNESSDTYKLSNIKPDLTELTIAGNNEDLDKLQDLSINVDISKENISENYIKTLNLEDYLPNNIYLADSNKKLNISMQFEIYTTKEFEISVDKIVTQNLNENLTCNFANDTFKLTFKGMQKDLDNLNMDNLSFVLDLDTLTRGKYNTPLKISNLPSNIVLTSDGIIPFSLNKK